MKKQLYKDKKIKIRCKYCKKEFFKNRFSQIYCNRKCEGKFNSEKRNKILLEKGIIKSNLKLRFEIFKRDNFTCQYCGRNPKEDGCKLHLEHIIPKKKGGKNNPQNLITSCQECNYGKSDVLLVNHLLNKFEYQNPL